VAHSLSAKKRVRQDAKRNKINRARKSRIKTTIKQFETTLAGGDVQAADEKYKLIVARLDKTAAAGTLHKKTAARKKSRLARRLNSLKAKKS